MKVGREDFEAFDFDDVNIEDKYEEIAHTYDNVLETVGWPDPEKTAEQVIKIGVSETSNILDMGCGTGLIGSEILKQSGLKSINIDGIDASQTMLAQAR
jgi:predicted TPR repeat methyltransferase